MKILFFDTETTGVPQNWKAHWTDTKNWPRLVQIGWVMCDENGYEMDVGQMTIKPQGFEIPQAATNVHGITTQHAKKIGFEIDYVLRKFEEKTRVADLFVCHHTRFDIPVLKAEYWRRDEMSGISEARLFCTKENSADILKIPNQRPDLFDGKYKWPSLEETYLHCFKEPMPNRTIHSALGDAKATARIYFHLFNKVPA